MTFDPYKLVKYHLYLLQLENYELGRFWKLLFYRGWFPKKDQRKDLVWTKKAAALFAFAEVLILLLAGFVFYFSFNMPFAFIWQKALSFLAIVYILDFFTPIILSVAAIILWPVDWLVKKIVVGRAKAKIRSHPDLKVIGIAGSYGKTTMKEVLKEVLSAKCVVLSTPESVNTPVGIARWILSKVGSNTEIIIVEMGEHYRGDVKQLCSLARPDISVVTGINEAHLERMKTLDNVVSTIFEIVSGSKPKSLVMLNGDDELVLKHYKEFIWPDHKLEFFGENSNSDKCSVLSAKFDAEKLGWSLNIDGVGECFVNLLGEYAVADVDAAIKIAKGLGMSAEEIKRGIANIKPVEHRLQPVMGSVDVLIIDDAYNGNPAGVKEAIKLLLRFTDRRKIYITPGLVEMGKATAEVHRAIGKQLAGVADIVILIKNSVTSFIAEGIKERTKNQEPRTKPEIIWFSTAQEAHSSFAKILRPGDVVVFQNDWGDNYL